MTTRAANQDLLHVLARDHRRFDERCRSFLDAPTRRGERLLRGLAVDVLAHEAVEQLLLHPLVADRLTNGTRLAMARLEEEDLLERLVLQTLDRPLASDAFKPAFRDLHRHMVEHTDREELEVFPYLRHVVDRRDLRDLGRVYTTLMVRIPTRLQCRLEPPSAGERRPLLRIRDTACDVLQELGHELPPGAAPGSDDLAAPVRGVVIDVSDSTLSPASPPAGATNGG
ncbi:MAG TPA: hemerythrin domain-containing protein [Egicoccus sp.]|nr:hemerythrin domain-containing protein [Egicoccus sp.]HSK22184.1 hemerythrin domain-containing protein [Egicoccus sp.]